MRTTVNSLARYYACIRAQIELMPAAEAYVEEWRKAMEKGGLLPDYEDYFREAAYAARVPILDSGPYIAYLEGCADDYRLPDPARIVQAIVHAYAETHLWFDKRCGCPARQLLLSPVREEHEDRKEEDGEDGGREEDGYGDEDEEEDDDEDDWEDEDEEAANTHLDE